MTTFHFTKSVCEKSDESKKTEFFVLSGHFLPYMNLKIGIV